MSQYKKVIKNKYGNIMMNALNFLKSHLNINNHESYKLYNDKNIFKEYNFSNNDY